jgi:hypothetical protein
MKVTASPKSSDHAHNGSTPIRLTSPSAETPDWMPNQPISEIPIATPTTALPPWPNPVHRVSNEVCRPSRLPMIPTPIETSSRITAPNVNARNASQKPIPNPSVEPSRNWLSAETCPNRCTATVHQEWRAAAGTRVSA